MTDTGYPYWRFEPDKWLAGKINFFGFAEQGFYLYLCNLAWINRGRFTVCEALAQQKLNGSSTTVQQMLKGFCDCGIVSVDGDGYRIKFIDIQLQEMDASREQRREAGRNSAKARAARSPTPKTEPEKRIPEKSRVERSTLVQRAFQQPTPQQVTEYALSIGFTLDGELFVAHYTANGWKAGRNQMKDWKAAVVTWKKRRDADRQPDLAAPAKPSNGRENW